MPLQTTHRVPPAFSWEPIYRWSPWVLIAFGLAISTATSSLVGMDRDGWLLMGVLAGAALVLQLWWGRAARERPGPSRAGVAYYAARWALAFGLTWINPFFAFFAAAGYFDAERVLPRRAVVPGLVATAATVSGAQSVGFASSGSVRWAVFAALLIANVAIALAARRASENEEKRARFQAATIRELERTNAALERAMDENAALHAQLVLQAREAGVADERRRLAAEIHDTVAQGLTGVITQLQAVRDVRENERTHLERALQLARHSLGEARRAVANLAPVALADDDLPEALKKTVAQWSERTGVQAEFTLTGSAGALHEEVQATLLRIAEEALSNTARHAEATRLGVTLSYMAGEVALDVRDDGRGFDPAALPARDDVRGFGLRGMRARAERLAGELTVESEPGLGTAVSVRVPSVPS